MKIIKRHLVIGKELVVYLHHFKMTITETECSIRHPTHQQDISGVSKSPLTDF